MAMQVITVGDGGGFDYDIGDYGDNWSTTLQDAIDLGNPAHNRNEGLEVQIEAGASVVLTAKIDMDGMADDVNNANAIANNQWVTLTSTDITNPPTISGALGAAVPLIDIGDVANQRIEYINFDAAGALCSIRAIDAASGTWFLHVHHCDIDAGRYGIFTDHAGVVLIDHDNVIHDQTATVASTYASAINANTCAGLYCFNNIIKDLTGSADWGVSALRAGSGADNVIFENNIIANIDCSNGDAIGIVARVNNVVIRNNTIYDITSSSAAHGIYALSTPQLCAVYNNIVKDVDDNGFNLSGGSCAYFDYNCVHGCGTAYAGNFSAGANDQTDDPRFVDPGNNDFTVGYTKYLELGHAGGHLGAKFRQRRSVPQPIISGAPLGAF